MAEGVWNEPVARFGHLAAAVESKLYVWGGVRSEFPVVHDGPDKIAFASLVDVLDLKVSRVVYRVCNRKVMSDE